MIWRLGLLLAAFALPDVAAGADCFAPQAGAPARIVGHDGYMSFTLEGGQEVRLPDLAPADPAGALVLPDGIMGTQAAVLPAKTPDGPVADRYGRTVGDLLIGPQGDSLFTALVREGLALVDPAVMSQECLDGLFAAEREAERNQRGVWQHKFARDAGDADLVNAAGGYVLVDGVVKSVGSTRRTIYLNFGNVYRTDFTVLVRRRAAKPWGDRLEALDGHRVRVRGVLGAWDGSFIEVEHPRQIEVLSSGPPDSARVLD